MYILNGGHRMNLKILGTGCAKCKKLESNVKQAVKTLNIEATIEKIEDIKVIMSYGVMSTPALVVNNQVKSSGRVLTPEEVIKLLA